MPWVLRLQSSHRRDYQHLWVLYFKLLLLGLWFITSWILFMVWDKGSNSLFCMWIASFSNIFCCKGCPYSTKGPWHPCQKPMNHIYLSVSLWSLWSAPLVYAFGLVTGTVFTITLQQVLKSGSVLQLLSSLSRLFCLFGVPGDTV